MHAIEWKIQALMACLAVVSGCASPDSQAAAAKSADEMVALDPTRPWEGKTLEEWAIEYMRWYYSPTDCKDFPTGDTDGSLCGSYQDPDSKVFFFDQSTLSEATPRVVERTKCKVPAGKAIFVPVALFFGDNLGLDEPLSDEESTQILSDVKASIRKPVLNADGSPVETLDEHRLGPVRFNYHVPPAPNRFGCDNARMLSNITVDPSFFVGIFVMFEPPVLGTHELEYSSKLTFFSSDLAFHVRSQFEVVK